MSIDTISCAKLMGTLKIFVFFFRLLNPQWGMSCLALTCLATLDADLSHKLGMASSFLLLLLLSFSLSSSMPWESPCLQPTLNSSCISSLICHSSVHPWGVNLDPCQTPAYLSNDGAVSETFIVFWLLISTFSLIGSSPIRLCGWHGPRRTSCTFFCPSVGL